MVLLLGTTTLTTVVINRHPVIAELTPMNMDIRINIIIIIANLGVIQIIVRILLLTRGHSSHLILFLSNRIAEIELTIPVMIVVRKEI